MNRMRITIVVAALFVLLAGAVPLYADDGRGGHYGGHSGGYHHGGGHYGFYGGLGYGLVLGSAYWGSPWYYPYGPYYYPYGYSYAPVAQQQPAREYIERARESSAPAVGYWYYCAESKTYYPYVRECPGGWQKVPAQPPSETGR